MTLDIMNAWEPRNRDDIMAIAAHHFLRMAHLPAWRSFARAIRFYGIDGMSNGEALNEYANLFSAATGVEIKDFVLGGMSVALNELNRPFEDYRNGWAPILTPPNCQNREEATVRKAFFSCRCGTIDNLQSHISRIETGLEIAEYNLIPISRQPLVEFPDGRVFALSLPALGRSIFDGVRHEIITKATLNIDPASELKRVGGIYGRVFQAYVERILKDCFADRLLRIDDAPSKGLADYVIFYPDKVIVLEVKGEHFKYSAHFKRLSLEERREELKQVGLAKSIAQIGETIKALWNGSLAIDSLRAKYDWTTTRIIPVVVTDENFPLFAGCWDSLYRDLEKPLTALGSGRGSVARLRFLAIDDFEMLPDIVDKEDVAGILLRWGNSNDCYETSLKNYLFEVSIRGNLNWCMSGLKTGFSILANRLGLELDNPAFPTSSDPAC